MKSIGKNQQVDAQYAGRAIGTMIFAFFGGGWIIWWSIQSFGISVMPFVLIYAVTAIIFMFGFKQFRRNKDAWRAEKDTPPQKRLRRLFNFINVSQWIVILIGAFVLLNFGLEKWIVPLMIFVAGLHFLPLAHLFTYPPHYVTGMTLIILSLAFPLFSPTGPANPIGCLGAGLILWVSALWSSRDAFGA